MVSSDFTLILNKQRIYLNMYSIYRAKSEDNCGVISIVPAEEDQDYVVVTTGEVS